MLGFFTNLTKGIPGDDLVLRFDGLTLRPPQPGDYAAWATLRQQSRGFLQPWEPTWPADDLSHEAFRRRLSRYREEMRQDVAYPFLIFDTETQGLLGGITVANVRRRAAQSATLGYWMGVQHASKGTMTRAVKGLSRLGFQRFALERLEAACLPENLASIRVLEKAGFHREGYARSYLSIAGVRRDHLLFARLKTDPHPE